MLFTDDFVSQHKGHKFYSAATAADIMTFLKDFLDDTIVRSEAQFMDQLEQLYRLARIKYTKGGHKTNQDRKIRKSFICQCHGRGSSYL